MIHLPYLITDPNPADNQEILYSKGGAGPYSESEAGLIMALLGFVGRQGGSATNWATGGTTNYPATRPLVQVGSSTASGSSGDELLASITFPVAYTYTPVVFVQLFGSTLVTATHIVQIVAAGTPTAIDVIMKTNANVGGASTATFQWVAIGPK
ncbi:hypothetical protein [Caudoviricetes sp.]|nr:hypothetical protein [Caudoviricetes sp.]UOF81096.1 hypothetical protein [Caudoviricetes sp.]UOF82223.1 hypothetical protein [Caudoviricetes sp.]UOF82441.1 hypothetical protein [Caudoviricetes sp.]UOF82640.1 hypothetical protein [Caudoviricetes sp.]